MNSREISDEDRTIIYGSPGEAKLSPEELRALLELPQGDDIKDYSGLSAIGMGGLGAVFSAQEPGLNREVALKVLRPEFRNQMRHIESFIREARTTAQIDHPNIVPVHRIGIFREVGVYFTMPIAKSPSSDYLESFSRAAQPVLSAIRARENASGRE